jgi:peptidoglycan/LPS O-acetylase OafA/YrhL
LLAATAYCTVLFDWRCPAWATRWPARTAGLSYTLYLVHWPLLVLLLALLQPAVQEQPLWAALATALGAALALVLAWALARWLERPAWFAARLREVLARASRALETRA